MVLVVATVPLIAVMVENKSAEWSGATPILGQFMKSVLYALILLFSIPAFADSTDHTIKRKIIADSIASYEGTCPCPYNLARNGSKCGKRSAYSRYGGESPICYERNVTDEMIRSYKKNHR